MNLKHGFYSKDITVNPDSVMMGNSIYLKTDELVDVENYLKGGTTKDPFFSHTIAVKILEHGRFTYPSLFPLALKYRKTEDYKTLSRLIEYFNEKEAMRRA